MIPGEILNYRIIRQLGSGGMGHVFLAKNKNIDQYVAIKVLHPRFAGNFMLRQKFKQEAVMLSSLNHPNIVRFLNYVENEYGVFLIMEYVDGMTLEDFINKKNGLIVEKRAYPMIDEILNAFTYAHARNIVHLDIKPSNIFITKEGHIKVMDFGIAKIVSETEGNNNSQVMGTPEYMSPEQVLGRPVDRRSDIYSLGVLIHQMLTGRAPYDSTTLSQLEIKQHVINDSLPKMKEYYPYVSEGMQKVVDKATNKVADKRFKDCAEMRDAVKSVLAPEPVNRKLIYTWGAVAAVVLIASFVTWDYFRTKTEYFKDYTEHFGVPVGIGELSGREMRHRSASYRLESSRHKPRRLTLVNSAGIPVPQADTENMSTRHCDVEYFYTDNGNIDYKKVYDQYGRLLFKLDYDDNLKTATYKYDDEYGTPMRIGAQTTNTYASQNDGYIERSTISRQLLKFNESTGLLEQMRYAGLNNEPLGDSDNIYGMEYQYDKDGHVSRVTFLGPDGTPRNNHIGLGIKEYGYDDDGNWTEVRYYAVDGSPSHDGNNCAVVSIDYDKWGNRITEHYYTANGTPAMRTDTKTFGFAYEYNDDGMRIALTNLGHDDKPISDDHGVVTTALEYDDNGRYSRVSYLDKDGNPCNYIEDGNIYNSFTFAYNDRGLITEQSYFALDGTPASLTAGVPTIRFEYDSAGYLLKTAYYDAGGNPGAFLGYNSAIMREYDDLHREVLLYYTDKDGKRTTNEDREWGYRLEYDVHGNVSKYETLGEDGKPTDLPGYITIIKYTYDERGNNIAREFYDEKDNKCTNYEGIHRIEQVYDPVTNLVTQEKCYGLKNLLHVNHYAYDSNGNQIKAYTLDSRDRLVGDVTNATYDKFNRQVKEWKSSIDGKKRLYPGLEYSIVTVKYDDRGNIIERAFFDTSGRPALDNLSTHRRISDYDDMNRVIHEKNLGKDGKPSIGRNAYPEGKVEYDERGNIVSLICLDGYGRPYTGADGFQKCTNEYNSLNKVTKTAFFDKEGNLTESRSGGYAIKECAYDSNGNNTSEKYYKASGTLSYELRSVYNDNGVIEEILVLDSKGKQNDSKLMFSRVTIAYEEDGVTPKTRKYFNAGGSCLLTERYNKSTGQWQQYTAMSAAPAYESGNDTRKAAKMYKES